MRFARKDAVPHPRDERSREDGYKREVSVQAVVARQRVPLVLRDATGADRKILKRRDFVLGLFHVGRHRRWAARRKYYLVYVEHSASKGRRVCAEWHLRAVVVYEQVDT